MISSSLRDLKTWAKKVLGSPIKFQGEQESSQTLILNANTMKINNTVLWGLTISTANATLLSALPPPFHDRVGCAAPQ